MLTDSYCFRNERLIYLSPYDSWIVSISPQRDLSSVAIMPNDCVAPGCDYGRSFQGKRSLFSFPKEAEMRSRWLRSIPRVNFVPSHFSRVCEVHYEERFMVREERWNCYNQQTRQAKINQGCLSHFYFQPSLLWWTWKDRRWMFQNMPLKFHLCREVIQPSGNWEMISKIDSWKERRRHGTASHSVFWSADSFFERVQIIEKLDSEDWCGRNSSVWAGTRKRLLVCAERYHALEWFCVNL